MTPPTRSSPSAAPAPEGVGAPEHDSEPASAAASATAAPSAPAPTPAPGPTPAGRPGGWIAVVSAAPAEDGTRRTFRTRTTLTLLGGGLALVLVVVVLLAALGAQWLAEREAVTEAATIADVLAETVVQPSITDELVARDPDAVAALDTIVRDRVLGDRIVRVKLWLPDGTVLYADEPQLVGEAFALDEVQREALSDPQTRAEVSDLSEEENEFETGERMVEVYRPVWAPDGTELLFEVYLPYEPVAARSADLWRGFAGVTTSSLLLFVVLTAPIVWGLIRRLRDAERRRAALLERAVAASDDERRRIAGTLHDGPVQDLVGTSLAAEGAAAAAAARGDTLAARTLHEVAGAVRGNVRVLRSLLVDIHPPGIAAAGVTHALRDLADGAAGRGVDVRLEVHPSLADLDDGRAALVHRVAQEAVRNVVAHAAPCEAVIRLLQDDDGGAVLEVSDDGPGFDPGALEARRAEGHLGTRVMADLARDAGAELSLLTGPEGTTWRLRIPEPVR